MRGAALLVGTSGLVALTLGAPVAMVCAFVVVVGLQTFAGASVISRVSYRGHPLGEGAVAIALGIGMSAVADVALHQTAAGQIAWILPSVAAVPMRWVGRSRVVRRPRSPHCLDATLSLIAAAALLSMAPDYYWTIYPAAGLALVCATAAVRSRHRPRVSRGTQRAVVAAMVIFTFGIILVSRWSGPHQPWLLQRKDFVFFRALSWSLDRYGMFDNPLLAGTPLHYHWLSYAWLGSVDRVVEGQPWQVLTIAGPALACVLVMAIVWAWIRDRTNATIAAIATALVAVVDTPRLWSVGIHVARLESFSGIFGAVYLVAIPLLLRAIPAARPRTALATIFGLLAFASKFSHGAVAAIGLTLAVVLDADLRRRATLIVGTIAGGFVAVAVTVFGLGISERGDSLTLGPLSFPWLARPELLAFPAWQYVPLAAVIVGCFLLIPIVSLGLLAHRWREWSRDESFSAAAIAGGALIFLLVARVEASQGFFLHSSLVIAIPLAASLVAGQLTWPTNGRLARAAVTTLVIAAIATRWTVTSEGGGRIEILERSAPLFAPLIAVAVVLGALSFWSRTHAGTFGRSTVAVVLAASVGVAIGNWLVDAPEYFRERGGLARESPGGDLVDHLRNATTRLTSVDEIIATNHSLCDGVHCGDADWMRSVTSDCELSPAHLGTGSCFLSYAAPLAGLLERRFWVNGFSFLSPGAPTPTDLRRATASLALSQWPEAGTLAPLREAGVKWFIVDKDLPHADDYGAVGTVRYE
ncbi:MAG: hypothetical protein ACKOD2_13390, partial [Ilumatobacteraceae bacterium]